MASLTNKLVRSAVLGGRLLSAAGKADHQVAWHEHNWDERLGEWSSGRPAVFQNDQWAREGFLVRPTKVCRLVVMAVSMPGATAREFYDMLGADVAAGLAGADVAFGYGTTLPTLGGGSFDHGYLGQACLSYGDSSYDFAGLDVLDLVVLRNAEAYYYDSFSPPVFSPDLGGPSPTWAAEHAEWVVKHPKFHRYRGVLLWTQDFADADTLTQIPDAMTGSGNYSPYTPLEDLGWEYQVIVGPFEGPGTVTPQDLLDIIEPHFGL